MASRSHGGIMPKTKYRMTAVYSNLTATDQTRLKTIARAKGQTTSEFVRAAILYALDNQEKLDADTRETKLEERIRKMENHLASLGARVAIDVGTLLFLIAANMPQEHKDEDLVLANKHALARLKQKLKGQAFEIKEIIKGETESAS